jgi:hypothetical protein
MQRTLRLSWDTLKCDENGVFDTPYCQGAVSRIVRGRKMQDYLASQALRGESYE